MSTIEALRNRLLEHEGSMKTYAENTADERDQWADPDHDTDVSEPPHPGHCGCMGGRD